MRTERLTEVLYRALLVDYRDAAVARLRELLTDEQVVKAFKDTARFQQIVDHQQSGSPYVDVWSVVDVPAIGQLIRSNWHDVAAPSSEPRAEAEAMFARLDASLRSVVQVRNVVAHPSPSNRPSFEQGKAAVEAACTVLEALGADSTAVRAAIRELKAIESRRRAVRRQAAREELPRLPQLRGREVDLTRFLSLVDQPHRNVFTVIGPAGVGKTTFARVAGQEVAALRKTTFTVVALSSAVTWARGVSEIARALELEAEGSPLQAVIAELQARPRVLLLDNFEHLLMGAPDVERIATHSPEVVLIVTCRERLDIPSEHAFHLHPLARPAADDSTGDLLNNPGVALFVDRLNESRGDPGPSSAELLAIAEIVRKLDGLPLALTISAAHAIDRDVSIVRDGLQVFLDKPTRKAGTPRHHQTMSACLDWSWDLLSDRERSVFRRAASIFGTYSVATLAAGCHGLGLNFEDVEEAASRLVHRSLIQRTEEGLTALQVMPQYITGKLQANDLPDIIRGLTARATVLMGALESTREPTVAAVTEVFSVGANVLARLMPGEVLSADEALPFLLGWCRLSWQFQGPFEPWDEDVMAALAVWAKPSRQHPSSLTARSLVELARLQHAYKQDDQAGPIAEKSVLEAVAANDVELAKAAAGVYVDIFGETSSGRRKLFRRLRNVALTPANIAALDAVIFPGYPEGPEDTVALDPPFAISGLQWLAHRLLELGDSKAAGEKADEASFLLAIFGARPAIYRQHVQLGEVMGRPDIVRLAHWDRATNLLFGSIDDVPPYEELVATGDFMSWTSRAAMRRAAADIELAFTNGRRMTLECCFYAALWLALGDRARCISIMARLVDVPCRDDPSAALSLVGRLIRTDPD